MSKKQMNNLVFLTILSFLLSNSGCKRIAGLPGRHVTRNVSRSEIVGTWAISAESTDRLLKEGYRLDQEKDHVLNFMDNGKCLLQTFRAVPSFPKASEEEDLYANKEAIWDVGEAIAYIRHERRQVTAIIITLRSEADTSFEEETLIFYIAEHQGNLILWRYIGDPDYREYFDFIKKNGEN